MTYTVHSESTTLAYALSGVSIARYGDGELRIAIGGAAKSQVANEYLMQELRSVLSDTSEVMACIPNPKSPREGWKRYLSGSYASLFRRPIYGSAFISRPDSAPWINTPEYWAALRTLWIGRDVVLVRGDDRSLRPPQMSAARSLREVRGPGKNAYDEIDRIEEEVGSPTGPVLMCLGATATALAARLARKGLWAVDLGHVGMFMRQAEAFDWDWRRLISESYKQLNAELHASAGGYGGSGYKHAPVVSEFCKELQAKTVLDYGAGECTLRPALQALQPALSVREYDPTVPALDAMPRPVDVVVCTDVLEHVEPECLPFVLQHIKVLAHKGVFLSIATRPSNKSLPDGRNAHLNVHPIEWWFERIRQARMRVARSTDNPGHSFVAWIVK